MGAFESFLAKQDQSSRNKENEQYLKSLAIRIDRINELEETIEEMEDEDLEAKTTEFRNRLLQQVGGGEDMDDILEEAFAVVREAAW